MDNARRKITPGFVYVIEVSPSMCQKIGASRNPKHRLVKLATDNHEYATIIHVIEADDMFLTERYVHQLLDKFRFEYGDWFKLDKRCAEVKELLSRKIIPAKEAWDYFAQHKKTPIQRNINCKNASPATEEEKSAAEFLCLGNRKKPENVLGYRSSLKSAIHDRTYALSRSRESKLADPIQRGKDLLKLGECIVILKRRHNLPMEN